MGLSCPVGCPEALLRHDHPCVPNSDGRPQSQPATRPPAWRLHRLPTRLPVNYARAPCPGAWNGCPGHRNGCPGAAGTSVRVSPERLSGSPQNTQSDGTVTVDGIRYEVPSAYRTLELLRLRVARWDRSSVELVDPRSGAHLAILLPLDKVKNADRARRALAEITAPLAPSKKPPGVAPLLRQLMAEYAATGLPPAYLPKGEEGR